MHYVIALTQGKPIRWFTCISIEHNAGLITDRRVGGNWITNLKIYGPKLFLYQCFSIFDCFKNVHFTVFDTRVILWPDSVLWLNHGHWIRSKVTNKNLEIYLHSVMPTFKNPYGRFCGQQPYFKALNLRHLSWK